MMTKEQIPDQTADQLKFVHEQPTNTFNLGWQAGYQAAMREVKEELGNRQTNICKLIEDYPSQKKITHRQSMLLNNIQAWLDQHLVEDGGKNV